ncbi:hypothetical protein B5M09_011373 [Aphanomyces astaci]|uniref:Tc1-like transposase DDE domain-containing protein n=1 Tax=Aphanomyces astaci TaxID=112090 RepID=A0A425BZC3_APHAT|nr:hypothetical protein B5M09_011373 [Aphanomyces astaci]
MDILWLQATLRYTNTEDVAGVVSQLLGRARKTVKGVLAEYLATHNLSVVQPPSNTTKHHSRVPDTHAVRALVQRFIRDRCVTRTRTVAKDVLSYLVENHVMAVDDRKVKDYAACLRSDVSHLLGLDIFVGGKKNSKVVKAYHSMFNHDDFVHWFRKLLEEVEELGWSSAVFVMDNAKYHKGKPKSTPKGTWRKSDLYIKLASTTR